MPAIRDIRVLHFCQSATGGPASYLEEIAGFQIARYGLENVRFLIPASHRVHVPGIPDGAVVGFRSGSRDPLGLMRLAAEATATIRTFRPDVLHLHSSFAGAVGRLSLIGLRDRPAVVYCPHGWSFAMSVSGLRRKLYAGLERALSPLTDKIITISKREDELARTYRLPGNKLVLIYSGIASEYKAPRSSFALDKSKINLLFAGRHDRQKGLDILLDAMRAIEHCPVHLHVVGAGVLSEARIDQGDRPNVTFHGWVPRDTVIEFLAEADAVVLPSRWEGLPLAALEAMRMDRAVIASDRSSLPEIVQHGRTGLIINIDSPDQIVETLRSLDRTSLRDMGRAGRGEFLQRFTAERMNRELNDLYHAVVSRRRTSTRKPTTNTRGAELQPPPQPR